MASKIFLGPEREDIFVEAIKSSGCELVSSIEDADGIIWFGRDPAALESSITPNIRWLQIPDAGAEKWIDSPILTLGITVTCASGIYGHQVAEHALALILGCYRHLGTFAKQSKWNPIAANVQSLSGAQVLIVGAGGIGSSLATMLKPMQSITTVMSKTGRNVQDADKSLPFSSFEKEIPNSDIIVLAAPATAETYQMINSQTLSMMKPNALIINVARGSLIETNALLAALDSGSIFGAGLDVTDPEPLPDNHPLFSHPRVLLTPHVANPPALKKASFARHVEQNCRRFSLGENLLAVIDLKRGY
jgi:D-3-phosphoglycerate dehydrogenase